MRGMFTRQATLRQLKILLCLPLLFGPSACSPSETPSPTPTAIPSPTLRPTPLPPIPTLTPTPLTCLSQPGELQSGEVQTNGAPTAFIIYLPPCYDYFTDQHYPVIYLLNGQTYSGDQWVRLGAPAAADRLILSGQAAPFIIVFPDDRYWNVTQGDYFGQFLVNDIVPYIDGNFRTLADREHRAVGGLSRGGGWALNILFTRPDVFGSVGLHSPAVLVDDRPNIELRIRDFPPESWPRLYLDTGDNDHERGFNTMLEELLTRYEIPHEWHLNTGAHDEAYWSEHAQEYLEWYVEGFGIEGSLFQTPTPQP